MRKEIIRHPRRLVPQFSALNPWSPAVRHPTRSGQGIGPGPAARFAMMKLRGRKGSPMRQMDPARYQKLKASGRLPSPKGVALAVIGLLRREDYQLAELVRLLKSDPAMAGRLLRFANAAALGGTRPVVAIADATLALGAHRVRDLVLGFSILHHHRSGDNECFGYETFWSRSLAMAIAAQALARHAQIAAEESFTLGLLCDIGVLALAAYDSDLYAQAQHLAADAPERMIEAESRMFGTDHRELGAALMDEWGLPEALVNAAFQSEAPDTSGLTDGSRPHVLALSLYFSRTLAEVCVAGAPERWSLLPELYAKAARLGIGPDELATLADDIVHRWRDWGAALSLQTQDVPPFAELLSSVPPGEEAGGPRPQRKAAIMGVDGPAATELAAMLGVLGYQVDPVGPGIGHLQAVLRKHPQLIIVAIEAADKDGFAFCRAFQADPQSGETHLILLGSREQEDRLSRAAEAGADDYLLWPISAASLRVRLRAANKIVHLREEIHRERRGLMRSAKEWAGSQRRMMELAFTDLLTRLPNRRYGLDFLASEWLVARADGRALGCLMVDVDHFKLINDEHGHEAGDRVLADLAQTLAKHCRGVDMPFRYGGEEFCVVCTDTDLATAGIVAERIRAAIEGTTITCGQTKIAATVSIGFAAIQPSHTNVEALLKDADSALYRAKQNGRNRIEGNR